MAPVYPKAARLKLRWTFILFMQAIILSTNSCRTGSEGQKGDPVIGKQELQRQLVEARGREKALQREYAVARNSEPYLIVNLLSSDVELRARGRTLRSFKIKQLKRGAGNIPDAVQVLSEVRTIQKVDRPKLKPGEGEAATAEAAEKNLWGLHRMPMDYDLACRDGMVLEFRALPSEQTGHSPFNFISTLYRKFLDWYRHGKTPEGTRLQTVQLWLDENDSRLLFWSLPRQLKILVIA